MKRRDLLKLIPFSYAGITYPVTYSPAAENSIDCNQSMDSEPLAISYTRKICEMLKWIRNTQSENILETSHAVARTIKNGGTCWCMWDMGHSASSVETFPGRNGDPGIFTYWYNKDKAKKGDKAQDKKEN